MNLHMTRINRLVRGGYYFDHVARLLMVCRYWNMAEGQGGYCGFRVVVRGKNEAYEE